MSDTATAKKRTGTLLQVWPNLTQSERESIAEDYLKRLGRARQAWRAGKKKHLGAGGFDNSRGTYFVDIDDVIDTTACYPHCTKRKRKMPPSYFGIESKQWCDGPQGRSEIWERVYRVGENGERAAQEQIGFCNRDVVSKHLATYAYTHMDMSANNVLVVDGKFLNLTSDDRAGYYPVWWQGRAFHLFRTEAGRKELAQTGWVNGMEVTPEMNLDPYSKQAINSKWASLLADWFEKNEETEHPFTLPTVLSITWDPSA